MVARSLALPSAVRHFSSRGMLAIRISSREVSKASINSRVSKLRRRWPKRRQNDRAFGAMQSVATESIFVIFVRSRSTLSIPSPRRALPMQPGAVCPRTATWLQSCMIDPASLEAMSPHSMLPMRCAFTVLSRSRSSRPNGSRHPVQETLLSSPLSSLRGT